MFIRSLRLAVLLLAVWSAGPAASQDSETPADTPKPAAGSASSPDTTTTTTDALEQCFMVQAYRDMNVLSDQHVYVRTRGGNHYLVSTERCEGLERSYHRGTASLVPHGSRICQNDGSYFVYENQGRERPCAILNIERVSNRSEAKDIAAGARPSVEVEPIEIP
jgi:hypothetical protein